MNGGATVVCLQAPQRIQVGNGSELISKALDKWAYANKVTLDFSRPEKPTDTNLIEPFNGSFRDECLNTRWFLSLDDARQKIEKWPRNYNRYRPHSSLGNSTPEEFAQANRQTGNLYCWPVTKMGEVQIDSILT